MKRKILVFFDQDVVIRAFYQSGTIKNLENFYDITYVFPVDSKSQKKYINIDPKNLGFRDFTYLEIPRYRMGTWYNLFLAKLINNHRGQSTFKNIINLKVKREVSWKIYLFLRLVSFPLILNIYSFFLKKKLGANHELEILLEKYKPECILYPTVLSGPFVCEIPTEAKKLNIKTIFCMNSWDNPMSKAIPIYFPDYLITWGEDSMLQAAELLKIPKEKIKCFGASQFEIYKIKSPFSRRELIKKFNVPISVKYILYAGVGESFRETKYLKFLNSAIENNYLTDCHVIYRPHPWRGSLQDEEENFFDLNLKHISMDPHMINYYKKQLKNPSKKFFMVDYKITRDLLTLVNGVMSPRSTILLEGILLGKKPFVIFPEEDNNLVFSRDNIHFKSFCQLPNVITCFKIEQFYTKIKEYNKILNSKKVEKEFLKNSQKIVYRDKQTYTEKLDKLIEEITVNYS